MAKEDIVKHQFNNLTAEKQHEIASKGGKASVEARRAKKDLQYFAKLILDEYIKDKKTGEAVPTRYAMLKRLIAKVLKDGDVKAYRAIAATAGEIPKEGMPDVAVVVNYTGVSTEAQKAMDELCS